MVTYKEPRTFSKINLKIPLNLVERYLKEMGFYKVRESLHSIHYRRSDMLHIILTATFGHRGEKLTMISIHRDKNVFGLHKATKLHSFELGQLISQIKKKSKAHRKTSDRNTV